MTLEQINAIDPRLVFSIQERADPFGPTAQATVRFGDGATLSVVTGERAGGDTKLGERFDVAIIIEKEMVEITWYEMKDLPLLLDALKIECNNEGSQHE